MIDIHCHILPEIDDGPQDFATAVEMAKIAADDGITTIVASPHIKHTIHSPSLILQYVTELNNQLIRENIPLQILPGADVYALLDPASLRPYTVNNTQYILIEFPYDYLPRNAKEIIFRFMVNGLQPIINHPERNPSVIQNPALLEELLQSNVSVQITADSLTGDFGPDKHHCAAYLLSRGLVDFIATDAHSSVHRRPVLSKAFREAEKIVGPDRATMLVRSNPEAAITGQPLLRQ